MDAIIEKRIKEWSESPDYDQATRDEIQALIDAGNEDELIDRFYQDLEFGTGGLRGIRGAGSNRMNRYNVMKVTQGLANYINRKKGADKGVVIGRDSRLQSDEFAETVAGVLLSNGIRVYYFDDIHPTPTVSYAIRHYQAISGIMVTASHNPKDYNGYKVFWDDGAQVTPPVDKEIIEEVKLITELSQVKTMDFSDCQSNAQFKIIDSEIDPIYMQSTKALSIHPEVITGSGVKICYSPLHGTGYKMVPEGLRAYGFQDIVLQEEQSIPDGNFPTTDYPNPESPEAMSLGIKTAKQSGSDVFIATDPDADRIGAALKQEDGQFLLLNGNQIASILAYYIVTELKAAGKMPDKPSLVSTIVTTSALEDICKKYGVNYYETLTGFKWIASKTSDFLERGEHFIFGCEESHGYNASVDVRDKDAVNSACLFAELTAFYKSQGKSVAQKLDEIYNEFGYYKESQIAKKFPGMEGESKIKAIMNTLRTETPEKIGKWTVLKKMDILTNEITDLSTGNIIGKTELPKSNVITLWLSDNARVVARPSGTEPKVKFYFFNYAQAGNNLEQTKKNVDEDHLALRNAFIKELGAE